MNASINQTATNKPPKIITQQTEEDLSRSNDFNKKKPATKLPDGIVLSPKKVQTELQTMMVMQ